MNLPVNINHQIRPICNSQDSLPPFNFKYSKNLVHSALVIVEDHFSPTCTFYYYYYLFIILLITNYTFSTHSFSQDKPLRFYHIKYYLRSLFPQHIILSSSFDFPKSILTIQTSTFTLVAHLLPRPFTIALLFFPYSI
jgi:hypothetical protein